MAGLVCEPGDIGLASGFLASLRQVSGTIAGKSPPLVTFLGQLLISSSNNLRNNSRKPPHNNRPRERRPRCLGSWPSKHIPHITLHSPLSRHLFCSRIRPWNHNRSYRRGRQCN